MKSNFFGQTILWLFALIVIVPLGWTLLNAFKVNADLLTPVPKLFFSPTLENMAYVLGRDSVFAALINSLIVCLSAVAIGLALGLPGAYAIARHPNRITKEIQFFVLSLRFLPPVAVAIPLMVIWLNLGIYDTRIGMIIAYSLITISITMWLGIPSFVSVPREVEEAARIDGYGPYAVFFWVALPVAGKSLLGALAFSFILVWNEFLLALMLTTADAKTLPIIASEMSQMGMNVPWGVLNAAVVLLSLPPLMLLGLLSGFLNRAFAQKTR
ncbi:carbohydrate ABC transporter permease [Oceaniovalibus sp. ACAM 378]|uniref:carbohydrate ABC transporter permease n=1 Tax=Oceaniovalibus sp. ACAM 378 TaxID=2599923 RepID=UPI0011DBAE60|nr:carbohydrate ABC transporter permease [Oceaniovalibus sp. ACAM 378]TYB84333.1 carbohydrate ABC transporter permease [Oceaniovalibus sp. ACAM 378]